ncbi:MAG: MATE family efflux transporter, partial [Oscillibacter sp.]|nr:MATE family efflux transporter [Oscillibacter sp.]
SAKIATALAVAGFAGTPLHACGISAITGVLRAGGDVTWATVLDVVPQWLVAIPLTALAALVLKAGCWPIAIAMQMESVVKTPLCFHRINSGKWINDVTRGSDK